MTREQEQHYRLRQERLREACIGLAQDTRFQTFMEEVRQMREEAVRYMIDHTTVKDEREYLAAVGETRVLDWLINGYQQNLQEALSQPEEER